MLVRLRDRFALLLGDAFISTAELHDRVIDGLIMDQEAHLRSGDEIRRFVRANPETLVIPSHDVKLFAELNPSYE